MGFLAATRARGPHPAALTRVHPPRRRGGISHSAAAAACSDTRAISDCGVSVDLSEASVTMASIRVPSSRSLSSMVWRMTLAMRRTMTWVWRSADSVNTTVMAPSGVWQAKSAARMSRLVEPRRIDAGAPADMSCGNTKRAIDIGKLRSCASTMARGRSRSNAATV